MKSINTLFFMLFIITILLAGCSSGEDAAHVESGEVALKVTGNVATEQGWTDGEVRAMETMEAESTNNEGEVSTYTGVLITNLLAEAQPNADATAVVFVADDGTTAEVTLDELNACTDCIVSFRNQGGFSVVMPGFSGKLQVKGVVEIQIK